MMRTVNDMRDNGIVPSAGFTLKGWMVLAALLCFFGVIAGANAVMIRYAISTFRGEQEPSPYEHGLAYKKDIEAARAQESLGWKVSAGVSRGQDGDVFLEVQVTDPLQRPVTGLALTGALNSPPDKKFDTQLALAETAPGIYSGRLRAAPGQWDLLLSASRDGAQIFRSTNRITLR